MSVRVPQITDIGNALEIYYNRMTLSYADTRELFRGSGRGQLSTSTLAKLFELARQDQAEHNILPRNPRHVNTDSAFRAWGLDVEEMEKKYTRLKKIRK